MGTMGLLGARLRVVQYATFVSHNFNAAFIVADSYAWRATNIHLVHEPRSITVLLTIEAYARACVHSSNSTDQ